MRNPHLTRRDFVKSGAALAAAATTPYWFSQSAHAAFAGDLGIKVGSIGVNEQGTNIASQLAKFGEMVAICDVDRKHAEAARGKINPKADIYSDYRKLLDRKEIDAITIATPDHWHTRICLDALAAGKHIYCEKPLTLTIDEGKQLVKAVKASGKTMQVGTMQRSDANQMQFARAVATVRSGQLGKIKKVTVGLPLTGFEGGPFAAKPVPEELDWDMWLGQAPKVDYCPERCHLTFRWWYEYSGGVVTDWGAHHMDIAHWALDCEKSGPLTIDGTATKLPTIVGGYNTPRAPQVTFQYPNDVEVLLEAKGEEGVLFEGELGRIYVNRGRITGKPIETQDADPKLKAQIMEGVTALFKDNPPTEKGHMGNFYTAFTEGKHPISDVESQHRTVSACHLANISIRLGRKLTWDATQEDFVGDPEASAMMKRPNAMGFTFPNCV